MLEIENKSYELASSVLEKSGIIDAEPAVFCMTQFESQEIPTLQPDEQGSVRQTLAWAEQLIFFFQTKKLILK